jgi:8-oxo-dGTP pyrophosphatase MutT (NUDIX family)
MDLQALRETARERLRDFPFTTTPDSTTMRRAAVLLCLVQDEQGIPAVIVIRRANRGRNPGQWGLPGGRIEAGETANEAALREVREELGLDVAPSEILGRLDDFPAASGFAITPIVACPAESAELRPNPDEIRSVHLAPVPRLAAPDTPHWVSRSVAMPAAAARSGVEPPADDGTRLLQMRILDDMTIHAPTGAILWQFREVVLLGAPAAEARVDTFVQPEWTHR